MHKGIDFSQLGGFPLTQDRLAFFQSAYKDLFTQLSGLGVNGAAPVIISGMTVTNSGNTVASGWFVYNGEMLPFTGGTVAPAGGQVALVTITATLSPLTYKNGSNYNVITSKSAALTAGATVTDALHFPVSALVPFGLGFGLNNRPAVFNSVAVNLNMASGNITGNVYWKLNPLTNTIHIKGSVVTTNPSVLPSSTVNNALRNLAYLDLRPSVRAVMTGMVTYSGAGDTGQLRVKNNDGSWLSHINVYLAPDGYLYADFQKPDAAFTQYQVEFNAVVGLD